MEVERTHNDLVVRFEIRVQYDEKHTRQVVIVDTTLMEVVVR